MAQRYAKENGQNIISLVNVPESTIARESDTVLKTLAGPEISVASTKAFTTQLITLLTTAVHWGELRGVLSDKEAKEIIDNLANLPSLLAKVLSDELDWIGASSELALSQDVIYLGRGVNFPISLEGALKLKEISYIHAEGYAAGEMKHGPIALLERVFLLLWLPRMMNGLKRRHLILRKLLLGGRVVCFLMIKALKSYTKLRHGFLGCQEFIQC